MMRRRRGIRLPTRQVEVLFLADAKWETVPPVHYHAGDIVTLRIDRAQRWVIRGLATDDSAAIAAAKATRAQADPPKPAAPVESLPLIQTKLGPAAQTEAAPAAADELKALRDDYKVLVGRAPFTGWSADQLREKIAGHKAGAES